MAPAHDTLRTSLRQTIPGPTKALLAWLKRLGISLSPFVVILLLWEARARTGNIASFILPRPEDVLGRTFDLLRDGTLTSAALVTMEEAGAGLAIAAAIALPLGYLMAHIRLLERFVAPIVAASQAVPTLAVTPLLVIWLDTGMALKVTVCAIIVVFSLLVATITGIRGVPREYLEVARVFGAPRWEQIVRVELPIAAPVLLGGLKVGVALALTGAIVGEFVAADQGLGFLLNYYRENLYTTELFATLIVLGVIGMALFAVVTSLERMVDRWTN